MTRRPMTEEERWDRQQARDSKRREEAFDRMMKEIDRDWRKARCADCGGTPERLPYRDAGYLCGTCVMKRLMAAIQEVTGASA